MHVHISRICAQHTAVRGDVIVEPAQSIYICKKQTTKNKGVNINKKKEYIYGSELFGRCVRGETVSHPNGFLPLNQDAGKLAEGVRYGGASLDT